METTTESPTDAPKRLFKVTSTVTLRKERGGRTRRHDGVPVAWKVDRSPNQAPFDATEVAPEDASRGPGAAAGLFTREEALRFLNDLEEECPKGEHRLQSVPLPASEKHLRYRPPGASRSRIEASGDLDVTGYCYLQDAEREGWEDGDTLLVETTLELPVGMAERLNREPDAAEYLRKLEETAEAVSEAPNPNDSDLPF